MRKLLLATTALAGAALCGAAEANMEVTVGGYNDFRAGFTGQDLSAGAGIARRVNDFQNEFQLEVEAKNKTSNGLEYGAVATLWNGSQLNKTPIQQANNVSFHQTYGYVNGSWGQVRAGDEHGASDFEVHAPMTYDFGAQVDGNYTEFLRGQDVFAIAPSFIDDDENSTKISYLTPKLGMGAHKVQLGVSYAPNFYDQGVNTTFTSAGAGPAYRNAVKVGGQYNGSFMDKVNASLGFVVQTAEGTGRGVGATTAAVRDFTSWDIGAQLGYAGFTVGGNYTDAGRFGTAAGQDSDQHVWSVGATYKFDRASVGGSYLQGKGYNNAGVVAGSTGFATVAPAVATDNYVDSYTVWGLGAGYSLFEGMTTSVDTAFFKQERPAGVGNSEGHVVILSNRVAF